MINYPIKVKVIDPATADVFWFDRVENEKELKNVQKLRYEILEKVEVK